MAKVEKKERLDTILQRLQSGEELGVYDCIVMFHIDKSTVYRDMNELESYEGVVKKSDRGETVWHVPGSVYGECHA